METQLDRGEEECPLTSQNKTDNTEEWMDKDMKKFYMVRLKGD